MSWRKHFTPVDNSGLPIGPQSNRADAFGSSYLRQQNNWLPEIYAGPANRLQRYIQYENMDADCEINTALDTIAEFATQDDEDTNIPFTVVYDGDPSESETKVIEKSLRQWLRLNDFKQRVFKIVRNVVKYGDQFFIRDPETYELYWVDPANIEKVIVNETAGKEIESYYIKNLDPIFHEKVATSLSPLQGRPYGSGQAITGIMSPVQQSPASGFMTGTGTGSDQGEEVSAAHVVHISLSDGLDNNWPFGISILEPVFKVFKQKELLEDSIIIYRVHRAPERRVFFIDVGNMPPHRARQYLEQVKLEVQQKRIPGKNKDGQNIADSAYNPMSMLEDYYFAQSGEGRGSKVDTLPGGENLGQIDDLKFFNNKLMRGLRVPSSYLPTGPDDGTATFHDGKVGVAYIQEFRFSKYVERLQIPIQDELDREFKRFLKYRGIEIDSSTFNLEFNKPMNFSSYKELQLDSERAGLFAQVQGIPYLSNQFKLRKYLGLTEAEITENEEYWKQENPTKNKSQSAGAEGSPGLDSMGVRPDPIDDVDLDAEVDMSEFGDDMGEFGDDMGSMPGEEAPPPGGQL